MHSKNNKTEVVKLHQKVVELKCISIHPSLQDLTSNIISSNFFKGLSEVSKQIIFTVEKPICIEHKGGLLVAISQIRTLIIASSLNKPTTKVHVQIYKGNDIEAFLMHELMIKPILYYHKPSDFGLAYKKIKSSSLKSFSPAFSSQENLSATLGSAKNTVFPPKKKLNLVDQNTNHCDENGEKAQISSWITQDIKNEK